MKKNNLQIKQTLGIAYENHKKGNLDLAKSLYEKALKTDVNRIMLDNFSPPNIYKAVNMAQGKIELEVSGGIDINNVATIAGTGVDYISIGALTKNIKAIDFSLLVNLVYVSR